MRHGYLTKDHQPLAGQTWQNAKGFRFIVVTPAGTEGSPFPLMVGYRFAFSKNDRPDFWKYEDTFCVDFTYVPQMDK